MEDYYFSTSQMTVGYDGVPLIRDIEIQLRRGRILTLIGPNGAGKSTILKSIIGQLSLLAGTVCLTGDRLDTMPEKERAKRMSVVLTERIRPELMTGEEVAAMGRYPYTGRLGLLTEEDKRIVRESMALVHAEEFAQKEFRTLSDGQKQRVMLAKAIAQEPDILVLDEPTSYLDVRYKLEFLSVLQEMTRTRGLTVILSLHELDLAERISDQVLCVKGEYVERCGPPEDVFTSEYIRTLYGITEGAFDGNTGCVELPAVTGAPQVFVIGGGADSVFVYRNLQRAGIPFAAGILWENDRDVFTAKALASEVVVEKAYSRVSVETFAQAERLMERCPHVICTPTGFGEWNRENEELFRRAKQSGKLTEGTRLWQK